MLGLIRLFFNCLRWFKLTPLLSTHLPETTGGSTLRPFMTQKLTADKTILHSGELMKKGLKRHNWKQRWFVLSPGMLKYYKVGLPFASVALMHYLSFRSFLSVALTDRWTRRR